MIGYIYKITNLVNNKIYIGSTIKKPSSRWSGHLWEAFTKKSKYAVHQAMRKYGKQQFHFEVIFCTKDLEGLEIIEDLFIKEYNSLNGDNGYNMIPAFYHRPLVSRFMKKEWSDPVKRKKRLKIQSDVARSRRIMIISVDIYSGEIKEYSSVNNAVRSGFSAGSITQSLKGRTRVGQGYVWFYKKDDNLDVYKLQAEKILGGFKNDFLIPIIGQSSQGSLINVENSFKLKELGFEPKAVLRVCRGKRLTYKGYYWKFKTNP